MITAEFHGLIGYFTFAASNSPAILRCAGAFGRGGIDGKEQAGNAMRPTSKRLKPPLCRFIASFRDLEYGLRIGRGACFGN